MILGFDYDWILFDDYSKIIMTNLFTGANVIKIGIFQES
jgi:hypothetical protein